MRTVTLDFFIFFYLQKLYSSNIRNSLKTSGVGKKYFKLGYVFTC